MDSLHLCLALGPIAVYFLTLGAINLSRRPCLVSGDRDLAALALALLGLAIVGPFRLFLPEVSIVYFGNFVWLMVLALYALWTTMIILSLRPRLVIYNITAAKLRPILAEAVEKLDSDARWAGDSLVLPGLGVQLCIDGYVGMKNVSLKSVGGRQDFQGWKKLETALSAALAREKFSRNPHGLSLLFAGALTAGGLIASIARDPQSFSGPISDFAAEWLKSLPW
jgi:hypothetical protein